MEDEIKLLSKWTAALWRTYTKYLRIELDQGHFDTLVEELRAIWEESGEDPLVMDMAAAFANDLDRRT